MSSVECDLLDDLNELPSDVKYFFERAIHAPRIGPAISAVRRRQEEKAARKAERAARRAAEAGPSAR